MTNPWLERLKARSKDRRETVKLRLDLDYVKNEEDANLPARKISESMVLNAYNAKYAPKSNGAGGVDPRGSTDATVRRTGAAIRGALRRAIAAEEDVAEISVEQAKTIRDLLGEWSSPPQFWGYIETLIEAIRDAIDADQSAARNGAVAKKSRVAVEE